MKKLFLRYITASYGSINKVPKDVQHQLLGAFLAGAKAGKNKLRDGGFDALEKELVELAQDLLK